MGDNVDIQIQAWQVLIHSDRFAKQLRIANRIVAADPAERTVSVTACWLEAPIDRQWTVAYRLLVQDGIPVIGELRIFPTEKLENRLPGEWSASLLGVEAKAHPGGITTGVIEK